MDEAEISLAAKAGMIETALAWLMSEAFLRRASPADACSAWFEPVLQTHRKTAHGAASESEQQMAIAFLAAAAGLRREIESLLP